MKKIKTYDKNSKLYCNGKPLFEAMDNFFSKYPIECRRLYDKNLETLKIYRYDELDNGKTKGDYYAVKNIIRFAEFDALGHEIFHMAAINREKNTDAANIRFKDGGYINGGLDEGITEYLNMQVFDFIVPHCYNYEVFVVRMLENIPNFFASYLCANHSKFIKLFPNKKDIYKLLFTLSCYQDIFSTFNDNHGHITANERNDIIESIKQVINNLITIELSFGKERHELVEYSRKFMDLIGSYDLCSRLSYFYPEYYLYAEKQIKERILKR